MEKEAARLCFKLKCQAWSKPSQKRTLIVISDTPRYARIASGVPSLDVIALSITPFPALAAPFTPRLNWFDIVTRRTMMKVPMQVPQAVLMI